jgi:DNA-binding response OmpR family regulator
LLELRTRAAALTRALRAGRGGQVDPGSADDAQKVVDAADRFEKLWTAYLRHEPDPDEDVELQRKRRHDIRTPIGHMVGYLELLGEDLEDIEEPGADVKAWMTEIEGLLTKGAALAEAVDRELKNRMPQAPPRATTSRRPGAGGRLLIIDDNDENLGLLSRQLQRDGHEVLQARTGRGGLQLLREAEPDLVLLDIMMPDMDGHETLAQIRAESRWRDTPVVMLSSLDDAEEVARCIDAGAQDHLPRPFVPEVMRARVAALLERKRLLDQLKAQHEELASAKARIGEFVHYVMPMAARLTSQRDAEALVADLLGAGIRFAKATGGAVLMQDVEATRGWWRVTSQGEGKTPLELVEAVARSGEGQQGEGGDHYLPVLDAEGRAHAVVVLHGVPEGEVDLDPLFSLSTLAAAALERADYERRLRNKIARLEVEVDAGAKARQVEAITETEYFKELRDRVSEIRARSHRGDGEADE